VKFGKLARFLFTFTSNGGVVSNGLALLVLPFLNRGGVQKLGGRGRVGSFINLRT